MFRNRAYRKKHLVCGTLPRPAYLLLVPLSGRLTSGSMRAGNDATFGGSLLDFDMAGEPIRL